MERVILMKLEDFRSEMFKFSYAVANPDEVRVVVQSGFCGRTYRFGIGGASINFVKGKRDDDAHVHGMLGAVVPCILDERRAATLRDVCLAFSGISASMDDYIAVVAVSTNSVRDKPRTLLDDIILAPAIMYVRSVEYKSGMVIIHAVSDVNYVLLDDIHSDGSGNAVAESSGCHGDVNTDAAELSGSRADILREAMKCVCGGRDTDYGAPEESFTAMAQMMTAYLRQAREDLREQLDAKPLTAKDAAMTLALLKCVRIATGNTPDSYVDLAGYAACAGELDGGGKNAVDP